MPFTGERNSSLAFTEMMKCLPRSTNFVWSQRVPWETEVGRERLATSFAHGSNRNSLLCQHTFFWMTGKRGGVSTLPEQTNKCPFLFCAMHNVCLICCADFCCLAHNPLPSSELLCVTLHIQYQNAHIHSEWRLRQTPNHPLTEPPRVASQFALCSLIFHSRPEQAVSMRWLQYTQNYLLYLCLDTVTPFPWKLQSNSEYHSLLHHFYLQNNHPVRRVRLRGCDWPKVTQHNSCCNHESCNHEPGSPNPSLTQ